MADSANTASTSTPPVEPATSQTQDGQADKKEPVVIICIGMAGSVSALARRDPIEGLAYESLSSLG